MNHLLGNKTVKYFENCAYLLEFTSVTDCFVWYFCFSSQKDHYFLIQIKGVILIEFAKCLFFRTKGETRVPLLWFPSYVDLIIEVYWWNLSHFRLLLSVDIYFYFQHFFIFLKVENSFQSWLYVENETKIR